jgi:hypothetical protein
MMLEKAFTLDVNLSVVWQFTLQSRIFSLTPHFCSQQFGQTALYSDLHGGWPVNDLNRGYTHRTDVVAGGSRTVWVQTVQADSHMTGCASWYCALDSVHWIQCILICILMFLLIQPLGVF